MSKYNYKKSVIDYIEVGEGIPALFLHGWGMDKRLMTGCFEPVFEQIGGY